MNEKSSLKEIWDNVLSLIKDTNKKEMGKGIKTRTKIGIKIDTKQPKQCKLCTNSNKTSKGLSKKISKSRNTIKYKDYSKGYEVGYQERGSFPIWVGTLCLDECDYCPYGVMDTEIHLDLLKGVHSNYAVVTNFPEIPKGLTSVEIHTRYEPVGKVDQYIQYYYKRGYDVHLWVPEDILIQDREYYQRGVEGGTIQRIYISGQVRNELWDNTLSKVLGGYTVQTGILGVTSIDKIKVWVDKGDTVLLKGYKVSDSRSDRYFYNKLAKIVQTEIDTVYYLLSHHKVRHYTSNKREDIPKKGMKPGVYVDDTAYKRLENLRKRYGITLDKIPDSISKD